MNIQLGPSEAARLGQRALELSGAAQELCRFADQDPGLAGDCGVEVNAVEARTLILSGAPGRLAAGAREAARSGRPVQVAAGDLEQLSRLDGVISLASSRIALKRAAMEAAEGQEGINRLGSVIGIATGAIGLVRSFF